MINLALAGYIMSFYVIGMNTKIDTTMRVAMQHKVGMFNLREEVFMYSFRPWDIRKRWTNLCSCPTEYKAYTHITNAPEHPESTWKEGSSAGPICALAQLSTKHTPISQTHQNTQRACGKRVQASTKNAVELMKLPCNTSA